MTSLDPEPKLPQELLDMILDSLFEPRCKRPTSHSPTCHMCSRWQFPIRTRPPLQLRLVNRAFQDRLDPIVFHQLSHRRKRHFSELSHMSFASLAAHVHALRLDITPSHMFQLQSRSSSPNVLAWLGMTSAAAAITSSSPRTRRPSDEIDYFGTIHEALVPVLSRFRRARIIHLTIRHDDAALGLQASQGQMVLPFFETMCSVIRDANLQDLEELMIGVPYEGGYGQDFFRDKRLKDAVHTIGDVEDKFRSVSVKLSDRMENFTIMPLL